MFKKFTFLPLALVFTGLAFSANKTVAIHPVNFFMTGIGTDVFYPQAVNADFLFDPNISDEELERTLDKWTLAGINTIRLRVDSLYAPDDPLNLYQESNGRLKQKILVRLDRIFDAAERRGVYVVLALFDLQRLAENWDSSPINQANGGSVKKLSDWFTDPNQLALSLERTTQIVERYKDRSVFCWEIGRGANVWELDRRPNNALREGACFWVIRVANSIRKEDDRKHLLALSFLPNTYPDPLLGLPQINLHFLQIRSRDPLQAAISVSPYINSIRSKYKKPVFVVDNQWGGDAGARESFVYNLFWASFASCSSAFISPTQQPNGYAVSDEDLHQIETLQNFIPDIDLSGVPREIVAPAELAVKDTYLTVETILGFDRIFWILRKRPADNQAQIRFNTVEGKYLLQWFDMKTSERNPPTNFSLLRKFINIESPEFDRSALGVLRLSKRAPNSEKPLEKSPAAGSN